MLCSIYWAIAPMCFHCPKDFTSFHYFNLHVILHIVLGGYSNTLLWSDLDTQAEAGGPQVQASPGQHREAPSQKNRTNRKCSPALSISTLLSLALFLAVWQVRAWEVRPLLQGYMTRKQEGLNLNPVVSSHSLSSLPEPSCDELLSLEFIHVSIRSPDICVIAHT